MKYRMSSATVGISLAVVGAALLPLAALAQAQPPISDAKAQLVVDRCEPAKSALDQFHRRETLARINRGRAYEDLLRQMSALNSRLAFNNVSQPRLVEVTAQLEQSLERFRDAFSSYDDALVAAEDTDCKRNPKDFYVTIEQARTRRERVGVEVSTMQALLKEYRQLVADYGESLPPEATKEGTP